MHRKKKKSKAGLWAVLLICAVALTTGGVLAKYVSSNRQRTEMESAQFHISSNYLEEAGAAYTVADWGKGFDILLYNYEKENIAQISGVNISYTVRAKNASVTVRDQGGSALSADSGSYHLNAGAAGTANTYHVLHVAPDAGAGKNNPITVTVTTTAPFSKTLKAEFEIQNNKEPDYTIADQNNGTILLTIKTNDYQNSMTVKWNPSQVSPDNTNVLMASWKDASPTGSFSVSRNSTYELLFFKNTTAPYSPREGTGTEITLG